MDANTHQGTPEIETDPSTHAPSIDAETMISSPADASIPWEPLAMSASDFAPPSGDGAASANEPAADVSVAGAGVSTAAEVDKIREILFGRQISEYESRFSQLEVRLAREIDTVRDDVVRRFDEVQNQLSKKISDLTQRLGAEQESRAEEIASLGTQLGAARDELGRAISQTSADADAAVAEIRAAFDEEAARQKRVVDTRTREIERHLEEVTTQLRHDKVDRSSMKVLFEQLAVHFRSSPSGDEG